LQNLEKLDLTKDENLELLSKYLGPPKFDESFEENVV
jgi:hypothetical protein